MDKDSGLLVTRPECLRAQTKAVNELMGIPVDPFAGRWSGAGMSQFSECPGMTDWLVKNARFRCLICAWLQMLELPPITQQTRIIDTQTLVPNAALWDKSLVTLHEPGILYPIGIA